MLREFDKAVVSPGDVFFLPVQDIIVVLFSFMTVLYPRPHARGTTHMTT